MKNKRNHILKVFKAKSMKRYESANSRRFLYYTRLINWNKGILKVYLKVIYGKDKDANNKMTLFYNDGTYTNKKDFELALKAFMEK